MKKSWHKIISLISLLTMCLTLSALPAKAVGIGFYYGNTPRRLLIIGICVAAIVVSVIIKVKRNGGSSSGFSNTHFDLNSGRNSGKPEDYQPNQKEIERLAFMYKAGQKTGEKSAQLEGKVMVKCPNCGAPVRFGEIMECDYCKTQITRKSVADQLTHQDQSYQKDGLFHKDPPAREFNPNRYYDENITGYDKHDEINQEEQRVEDYYNDYRR